MLPQYPREREMCKQCVLGLQYGMKKQALALRIGCQEANADLLIRQYKRAYPIFWRWIDEHRMKALFERRTETNVGWPLHLRGPDADGLGATTRNTIDNFPIQGTGASILQMACIYLTRAGIRVCSTLHDAVLIEAPLDSLEDTTLEAQRLMKLAGSDILYGFALRSDATPVRYPGRYQPEGGQEFWHKVWGEMLHQDAPKCAVAST